MIPVGLVGEVAQAIQHAHKKHGTGSVYHLNRFEAVAVLAEEVGEVARAALEHDPASARIELLQVAAVAIEMIRAIDAAVKP